VSPVPEAVREARAFWVVAKGEGRIIAEPIAEPEPGDVLVQALSSGVSRGTELLVFAGRVPRSEYERMRAPHQAGGFPWPVKYGYSSVGRVVAGAEELEGRVVFCLHPHQTAYVVPKGAVFLVPEGVPPGRAILAANCETALNAVWDAHLGAGDRVAVVGAGTVGLLVAWLAARHPGTEVEIVDVDMRKAQVADALGVTFAAPHRARPEADVVFHASGAPVGLEAALSLAGQEASVVELSWFGEGAVTVPLGGAFHSRRLQIRASQVGQLPPERRARWSHRRRLETALRLLADDRLDALVTGETPFDDLPRAMEALLAGEPAVCRRVVYPE